MDIIPKLQKTLEKYKDKRVVVIGTTCTGKSTFAKQIRNAKDMDEFIFPLLSKEEKESVCKKPWTKEIGKIMTQLTKARVNVKKGHPFFGTILLDCDLIIDLEISDNLLKERCKKRNAEFVDAKNMQKMILKEIKKSNLPVIKVKIG